MCPPTLLKVYRLLIASSDNMFMASTYKDVVAGISSELSESTTVNLSCEVTKITNSKNGAINVEAANGFQGSFDDIIVTAPLGWLKRNENAFAPPLEPQITSAIQNLGYGNLDKVFIRFPRAFWDDKCMAKAKASHFPIESLFLRPEYAHDTNSAEWRQEIISMSGLPGKFSQPIIMFFVYGQWGRHITGLVRGMPQDSIERSKTLREYFEPYYSKLPNYTAASANCKPLDFMLTDWQGDRFAGFGSFTNQPLHSGEGAENFKALTEGMGTNRGIWFAGEHTSPPGGLGTVTGAYWSGERVAKQVASRHGITIDVPDSQPSGDMVS